MPSNLSLCYILSPWLFLSYSGVFVTSITVIKCHGDGNLTKHFLGNCSLEVSQSITIMTGNMAAGKQTWYSDSSWELHPDSQAQGRARTVVEPAKPSDWGLSACPAGLRLTLQYFLTMSLFPPLWFRRLFSLAFSPHVYVSKCKLFWGHACP